MVVTWLMMRVCCLCMVSVMCCWVVCFLIFVMDVLVVLVIIIILLIGLFRFLVVELMSLCVIICVGLVVMLYLDDLVWLCIVVFCDWLYLYEGDFDYEWCYLVVYVNFLCSVFVLVIDGDMVVGVFSGILLVDDGEVF